MIIEGKRRSVLKAISWRILGSLATMLIVLVVTRKLDMTLLAGGLDLFGKIVLYYFHERFWNKLKWGKKTQVPFILWFTGLSGSGKSTLAQAVGDRLKEGNIVLEHFDGDILRDIFPNTGFSKSERDMHIRRVGFLAGLLAKNGISSICSLISPYRESRKYVRDNAKHFVEIYVSTPIQVCEKRDPKGLYKKVRRGEIRNFTGIDDPYEPPESPEISLDTSQKSVEECINIIFKFLKDRKYV